MRREAIGSLQKRSRQRGAAAVFAAIAMVALITAATLVIDVGRMYTAQQELRKLTHLAAADAARTLSLCDGQTTVESIDIQKAVQDSLNRNNAGGVTLYGGTPSVGRQASVDNTMEFQQTPLADATAVRVELERDMPKRLLPFFTAESESTMRAAAVGTRPVIAELSIGSSLLDLHTENSALLNAVVGGLLGGNVSLSVAGIDALVGTSIRISDIMLEAGVGTTEELLDLELSLPGALNLLAGAVSAVDGPLNALAAGVLDELAAAADPSRSMRLGDILNLEDVIEPILTSLPLNTADLLMAVAQAGATGIPIELPVALDIPGILKVYAQINISKPPQLAVGPPGYAGGAPRTEAHSAAVDIDLSLSVLELPVLTSSQVLGLDLGLKVGSSSAIFESVRCARFDPDDSDSRHHAIEVKGRSALLAIEAPPQDVLNLGLNILGIEAPVLKVILAERSQAQRGEQSGLLHEFLGPFVPTLAPPAPPEHRWNLRNPTILSGLVADLNSEVLGALEVELLGSGSVQTLLDALGITSVLTDIVIPALDPVLVMLDEVLVELLGALGIELGSGQVTVQSVQADQPRVVSVPITQ